MNFGVFAESGEKALLMTDSFNPYYYRGWTGWWGHSRTLPGDLSGTFIGARTATKKQWTVNGVVYHQGGAWTMNGAFYFPRFSETDLIFLEPLSGFAGITVNSLTAVEGGARWKLDYNVMCDKALYDWVGGFGDPWPDVNLGWNAVCPALPKIHVFSQLAAAGLTSERYGIAIFDKNGKVKYNSSNSPLRVKEIISVNYPEPTAQIMDRVPTGKNYTPHSYCKRPMYCVPTVSQAVSQFWWSGSITNKSFLGDAGASVTTSWSYQFWGVYGGVLASGGTSSVQTSWATQGYGSQTSSSTSGNVFFGLIPTGSNQASSGAPPYTHTQCNSTNVPCLVADAADYD